MHYLLPLLFFCFSMPHADAQFHQTGHPLEAGIMLGLAGYSGDVSAGRVDLQELRPAYGAFVRYQLGNRFAIKGQVYAGAISGDDKYSDVKAPRQFKFGTALVELAGLLEWQVLGRDRAVGRDFFITPVVFAGLGYTFADADAQYYGPPSEREKFLVVPLPEANLKNRFLLPLAGGGIRMAFFDQLIFGLEGGLRPVLSDDIDGVSLNGNPGENDWYYFFGATVAFRLN
ncbi:MAG: DUF6089 family protein [Saprospiraceae bacterium]|nr:hypothetical protein [Lewinellaceae bacterium]